MRESHLHLPPAFACVLASTREPGAFVISFDDSGAWETRPPVDIRLLTNDMGEPVQVDCVDDAKGVGTSLLVAVVDELLKSKRPPTRLLVATYWMLAFTEAPRGQVLNAVLKGARTAGFRVLN